MAYRNIATVCRRSSGHSGSGKTYDAPFRANAAWLTSIRPVDNPNMHLVRCRLTHQINHVWEHVLSPVGRRDFLVSAAAQARKKIPPSLLDRMGWRGLMCWKSAQNGICGMTWMVCCQPIRCEGGVDPSVSLTLISLRTACADDRLPPDGW